MHHDTTSSFFARSDNKLPPRTPRMVVRYTLRRDVGPYRLTMESSCKRIKGRDGRIAGAVRLKMVRRDDVDGESEVIKRCQVDNWYEADRELDEAERLIREDIRKGGVK